MMYYSDYVVTIVLIYFECNYGDGNLPLDRWFGTLHDGSDEAQERMIKRMKERRG